MALYMDESEVWKCPKHPSRRRRNGICPKCLRDRLVTLCPNCANALPCECCPPPIDSSATSSSSSLFSFSRGGSRRMPATATESNIDPILRKSRSVAPAFLRSKSKHVESNKASVPKVSRSKINFWSVFTINNKSKKCDVHVDSGIEEESNKGYDVTAVEDNPVMMRSRSVAVGGGNGLAPASLKHKGWYFPSPSKMLRQSKPPRSVAVS
ncbi:uncharacterized protein LOC143551719 [Bidens hawaiensis]|uniref:uncharacterized protein LOC143551719 n=1 Tax=Bidens hawaiensis TaxID=980011 RepID=UPI00404B2328